MNNNALLQQQYILTERKLIKILSLFLEECEHGKLNRTGTTIEGKVKEWIDDKELQQSLQQHYQQQQVSPFLPVMTKELVVEELRHYFKNADESAIQDCALAISVYSKHSKQQVSPVWVKASEMLPDDEDNRACKNDKGKIVTAFYTKGGTREIEFEDNDDAPDWVTVNKEKEILTINAGWYEEVENVGYYDYMTYPRKIVEWLDESKVLSDEDIEKLAKSEFPTEAVYTGNPRTQAIANSNIEASNHTAIRQQQAFIKGYKAAKGML